MWNINLFKQDWLMPFLCLLQISVNFEAVIPGVGNCHMSIWGESEALGPIERVCWGVNVGQEGPCAIKNLETKNKIFPFNFLPIMEWLLKIALKKHFRKCMFFCFFYTFLVFVVFLKSLFQIVTLIWISQQQLRAECKAAWMKIGTSKYKIIVLSQKRVECLLWVEDKVLPQMEEFKCLRVLLTNERKMGQEIDRWIGVSAEIPALTQIWCGEETAKQLNVRFISLHTFLLLSVVTRFGKWPRCNQSSSWEDTTNVMNGFDSFYSGYLSFQNIILSLY